MTIKGIKYLKFFLTIIFLSIITSASYAATDCKCGFVEYNSYNYPIDDPIKATLIGTPEAFKADLRIEVPMEPGISQIFPEREIPELFWYIKGLPFAVSSQNKPAPIMYVLAGTGSGHLSTKMITLRNIYYSAGYHVVLLPSTTYPSFIAAASKDGVPGRIATDIDDLVRVIQTVNKQVSKELEITGMSISGYSLGAMHALFITERVERTGELTIDKTIAINPPVSLFESINVLDGMLANSIPGGMNNIHTFYEDIFGRVANFYAVNEKLDFSDDFLYRLQQDQNFDEKFMSGLISLSFRMSLANMLFTSDVVTDSGFIKPKGYKLSPAQPLTQYFQATARFSYEEYLEDYLLPFYQKGDNEITREFLAFESDLRSIELFLRESPTTYLVTNTDDIALRPTDPKYLASVFGDRAILFPKGGHLGNLEEKTVVSHLISIAKGEK
ncbi:MAG: hypothetical protein V7776_12450 [Halopseudomonas aestusnigri]